MNQTRTNPGKAQSKSRNRRRLRSPATAIAQSNSPFDALVKGLASIGERFFRGGGAQLRIP